MKIDEAAARLRLLQHTYECIRGQNKSFRIPKEEYIRREIDSIKEQLLLTYTGQDAKDIIHSLFRLTIWDMDIHPYSDNYQGPYVIFGSIAADNAYRHIFDIMEVTLSEVNADSKVAK